MKQQDTQNKTRLRKRLLLISTFIFIVIGVMYAIWWLLVAAKYETTDDAYVHGNLVTVNAKITGTVTALYADDTDLVKQGDQLISLDPIDTQISLDQAKYDLALAVRKTSNLYNQNDSLAADIEVAKANIKRAETLLEKADKDLQRRRVLQKAGGVSTEEYLHAKAAANSAQAELAQAKAGLIATQAKLKTNQALTQNISIDQHPDVLAAKQKLLQAWLEQQRTSIYAPVSGMVAKRSVQLGQHVQAGPALMTIVPLKNLWVEANFKENQLKNMHPGQTVELVSDIYGDKIIYHGVVQGISAGSGSAFALLPAQNASGNWIKVIQRVPVRIKLNPKELAEHPLRVGLSMLAKVDLSSANKDTELNTDNIQKTTAFDFDLSAINQQIDQIVQDNLQP